LAGAELSDQIRGRLAPYRYRAALHRSSFIVRLSSFPEETVLPNEQLWAPWRLTYLVGDGAEQQSQTPELSLLENADPQCFLCRASVDDNRRQTLTPWRGERAVVVLNRYPYINGHLLVAPRCHWARLDQLSADDHAEITSTITRAVGVLERLMKCEGFNIGLNLGRVAGAGVPGHLHWHIVPRWNGDTNFMPVLANTAVISQALESLFDLLDAELNPS
jgi:ATP adenylyltransferase